MGEIHLMPFLLPTLYCDSESESIVGLAREVVPAGAETVQDWVLLHTQHGQRMMMSILCVKMMMTIKLGTLDWVTHVAGVGNKAERIRLGAMLESMNILMSY